MAQTGSADPAASAVWHWCTIGASVLAAWAWVLIVVYLAPDYIGDELSPAAYVAFTLVIYVPLLPIAVMAGLLTQTKVLRGGHNRLRWTVLGGALGAGGLCATLAMNWLNGGLLAGSGVAGFSLLVLLGITVTLVQSAMEEVLFRGWLQTALSARLGQAGGVIGATVLFMGFHLLGGSRQFLSLVVIAMAGMLFGLLALRSGGLLAPVAAHAAWNASENSVFGLVPNPGNEVLGSILDFDLAGNPLWGGSDEGLNASLGAVLVLSALILPLLVGRTAKPAPAASPA